MTAASTATIPTQGKPPAILSLIGDTPLVEITRIDTGPCQLFMKLENQNPTGSIKDRIALSMIEAAERDGKLRPGGTIIEATAGNTGLGLALIAGAKGYRIILVIPDKMSQEKIAHVRALGAEVRMTRSDVMRGHPEYYQDMAVRLAEEIPGGFYVNQFGNPANPLAHERTHRSGNLGANAARPRCRRGRRRIRRNVDRPRPILFARAPGIEMILADPTGSVLYEWVKKGELVQAGSWAVEGIGEDFIPDIADMSLVTDAFEIDDAESFAAARELLSREGILGGSSTGTLLAGALRYCRAANETETRRHFCLRQREQISLEDVQRFLDGGAGLRATPAAGRFERSDFASLRSGRSHFRRPDDTLLTAFKRMRSADVSQVPVVDERGRAIGILDESDVLVKVHHDQSHFNEPVKNAMSDRLETLSPKAKYS